ncbi:soluble quino protein glucose dehydrogenase [Lophiostoma macrostomum CBS 122681]|uniref:Soluble quino protein glucose dehydrogenase n=1 Tax=Lophiostoma macrostomum CBS 122681 TaxID=1314788 RepID=A0A6A6T636_9PLEO|nr:soluble quino protein glucose dehydrogenase [Lophiostoma macrostomum CBS 122681]
MSGLKSLLALLFIARVNAQTSTAAACTIAPSNAPTISVAAGWTAQVVASGLKDPRGIIFDQEGRLLVVQQGYGISRLTLTDDEGACVRANGNATDIIVDSALNHGIEFSADGRTLYASSPQSVFAWDYDASQGRNSSGSREIIGQMGEADGHVTRTLLMSRHVPDLLLVSRGSLSNLDPNALNVTTGISTIKAFNISNTTTSAYNFPNDGLLLGWGLRNSVGVAEDPVTGAVYSVENSVDNFEREGQNIHQNNPGEEMNYHGFLNSSRTDGDAPNFGYPSCYAAWNVSEIPQNQGIQVGTQFAIGDQNATVNDSLCLNDHQAPRLTFAAHQAPLDLKFNSNGSAAWVTFHGSWDRDEPIGYKLAVISFENGQPTEPSNSTTAAIDIVTNPDLSKCPDQCLRPVGLAWDSQGRLFMSSDSTGEIYVITRSDGSSANDANPSSGLPAASSTGAAPSATNSQGSAAGEYRMPQFAAVFAGIMALPLM